MARVDFYHLTRDGAAVTTARLTRSAMSAGMRVVVAAATPELRADVDQALWTADPESFIPHNGAEEAPNVADRILPALIRPEMPERDAAPNGAGLAIFAGAPWDDAALGYDRAMLLFDGQQIDEARALWRRLGERGDVERHYWKQDARGKWTAGP